jgi:nitrogen regulatory protein P-II 1
MKHVSAVIRPFMLEEVTKELQAAGASGLTTSEVKGYGRQRGHAELYRGAEYQIEFNPKVKLEVVVPDELVGKIIDVLVRVTRTGAIGDGKIFVSPLDEAVRVRSGERGDLAL